MLNWVICICFTIAGNFKKHVSLFRIAEIQKDVEYRLPFTVNNLSININM